MRPQIELPAKLVPVFLGKARYRGAYGGRGSAKSRSFAKALAAKGAVLAQAGHTGLLVGGREYMNSLADSSFAEIKHAIASEKWLADRYDVGDTYIRTKDRRIEFAFVGLRLNLGSIKSKARIHVLWIDEAEPVSETAWQVVVPTVREIDSELWITWNPENKTSATNQRFKETMPDNAKIVEMNWRDNPWFPKVLEDSKLEDLKLRPESYDHIWEGAYRTHFEGAYYAKQMLAAKLEGRICHVPEDPLMTVRLFADIGGTGARADNFVFGASQFIGKEIRVINHYEVQGQPIGAHLDWLREHNYPPKRAQIWLPHDGVTQDKVFDVSYETAFRKAGYNVEIVPNQGTGAAMQRIEALRNVFPFIWFDEKKTEGLRLALNLYHEKKCPIRGIGLGAEHDANSHSADMAGMMALCYEEPKVIKKPQRRSSWRTA